MGQMTHAVIYGCMQNPPEETPYGEGWFEFIDDFPAGRGPRPGTPSGDYEGDEIVGFWVAVGESGEDRCPSLDEPFALDGFRDVKAYAKSLTRAEKAWEKFAAWCAKRKITLGPPRLWLVQTEVA